MGDETATLKTLGEVFPHLSRNELLDAIQSVGSDVSACFDYLSSSLRRSRDGSGGAGQYNPFSYRSDDQAASEQVARQLAKDDWIAHQEALHRKAQEDLESQNLIAAMQLEEKLEQEARKTKQEEENATLQLLEMERLERQADLEGKTYECTICADEYTIEDFYTVDDCDHRVCLSCMKGYVESKISDRDIQNIPCPMGPNCKSVVSFDQVRHVLPRQVFQKYDAMLLDVTLENEPTCRFCPRPGCGTAMLGDSKRPMMICPRDGCNFAYCFNCREAWHADASCAMYQAWKQENATGDTRFANWASEHAKPCPKCSVLINKDGGCNHMKCTRCNTKYCWTCLGDYSAAGHACQQFS